MRYDDGELQDLLAADFVLGTMTGGARRRFLALEAERPDLAHCRQRWEQHFAPWSEGLAPVDVPVRVWKRLSADIVSPARPAAEGWLDRLGLWRGLTAAFAVATLALVALFTLQPPAPDPDAYVAVIGESATQPKWLVRVDAPARTLRVTAVGELQLAADKTYQLWMLPGGDANPVSLGLLPLSDELTANLSALKASILRKAGALAVSIEPAGGSPIDVPTGPVVFSAALIRN